jgi:hypothetical protein
MSSSTSTRRHQDRYPHDVAPTLDFAIPLRCSAVLRATHPAARSMRCHCHDSDPWNATLAGSDAPAERGTQRTDTLIAAH